MYDLKIFLENNGKFGARLNAGKDVIYSVGNSYNELLLNLREELIFSFEGKKLNNNSNKLFSIFKNIDNKDLVCH